MSRKSARWKSASQCLKCFKRLMNASYGWNVCAACLELLQDRCITSCTDQPTRTHTHNTYWILRRAAYHSHSTHQHNSIIVEQARTLLVVDAVHTGWRATGWLVHGSRTKLSLPNGNHKHKNVSRYPHLPAVCCVMQTYTVHFFAIVLFSLMVAWLLGAHRLANSSPVLSCIYRSVARARAECLSTSEFASAGQPQTICYISCVPTVNLDTSIRRFVPVVFGRCCAIWFEFFFIRKSNEHYWRLLVGCSFFFTVNKEGITTA